MFRRFLLSALFIGGALPLITASVVFGLLWSVHQWNWPNWILMAVGVSLFIGLSYATWRVAWKLTQGEFRFSLRGMLIGVAVVAIAFGTVGRWLLGTYHQQRAVYTVQSHGGRLDAGIPSKERGRLHWWMGHDPFERVEDLQVASDSSLAAAIDHADQLGDITIVRFRRGVTALGFSLAGKLNQFPKLGLGEFCESTIDDQGLAHLTQWSNVRHLFFNSCPNVTDAGLRHLVDLPKLEVLDLYEEGGGMMIGDAGLKHVAKIEPLQCLHLVNMPKITDAGLAHLHELSNLKKFTIRGSGVTAEGLRQFYKAMPDCHIVSDVFVPGAAEVQRIVVWNVGVPDVPANSIFDPTRIGEIRKWIKTSQDQRVFYDHDFRRGEPWPGAIHRLEFMGKTRVLYEILMGHGLAQQDVSTPANNYPDVWVKWSLSGAQETQFAQLLEMSEGRFDKQ